MHKKTIFHFQKAGLWTTVQDEGRSGFQQYGVPVGGVMDEISAAIANRLVGNPITYPVLEITLFGPTIAVAGEAIIALTGADLNAKINGRILPLYQPLRVKTGDCLHFGKPQKGCRAYLAIAGEWQVKPWLNSASAATQNAAILTPDSIVTKGSRLVVIPNFSPAINAISTVVMPEIADFIRVKVSKGIEYDYFPKVVREQFFGKPHTISTQANRMGYRLTENLTGFAPIKEIISSGVLPGTVQITHAGQPIILMKDAQTTGGYWRLCQVFSADLPKLGQLKPGDQIWFSLDEND